jgi:hypothetical protein
MAITTQLVTVGTASATLSAPTVDAQLLWIENLEPSNNLADYSREGHTYVYTQYFQIANGGTALFSFQTGATGAQFEFWQFDAQSSSVLGELIESPTVTTTGSNLPGRNLNRNVSDNHSAVLRAATAVTGGTVIFTEFVPASNQDGGGVQSNQVITLKPNTQYGFRFTDKGGTGTFLHIQVAWAEQYNGYNDVWINGPAYNAIRLRGGEKIQLELGQGEGLTAVALRNDVQVAVMRQD